MKSVSILRINFLLLISLVAEVGLFVFKWNHLPPQIPLFYSTPDGDGQLADTFFIFLLPVLMVTLIGVNSLLQRIYFKNDSFVEQIFYCANGIIVLLMTLIFFRIILLIS